LDNKAEAKNNFLIAIGCVIAGILGYLFMRYFLDKEYDFQYSQRDIGFFMVCGGYAVFKVIRGIYFLIK
jgi:hypothetical protein